MAQWSGVGVVTFEGVPPPPTPPVLTVPPGSQSVEPGQDVSFFVLADGTFPFTYQWFKDGAPIAGATEPTLALADVEVSAAGDYSVQVSNAAGSVTSAPRRSSSWPTRRAAPACSCASGSPTAARANQNLPDSADWFTSSGSSNFTARGPSDADRELQPHAAHLLHRLFGGRRSRWRPGQTLTLDFVVQFTGFDTGASVGSTTLPRRAAALGRQSRAGTQRAGLRRPSARRTPTRA